jgi:hypothetical protein
VVNEAPITGGQSPESDDQLRDRAKHALDRKGNATLNAINTINRPAYLTTSPLWRPRTTYRPTTQTCSAPCSGCLRVHASIAAQMMPLVWRSPTVFMPTSLL